MCMCVCVFSRMRLRGCSYFALSSARVGVEKTTHACSAEAYNDWHPEIWVFETAFVLKSFFFHFVSSCWVFLGEIAILCAKFPKEVRTLSGICSVNMLIHLICLIIQVAMTTSHGKYFIPLERDWWLFCLVFLTLNFARYYLSYASFKNSQLPLGKSIRLL